MNHMDPTLYQQSSPAKAGDPLLLKQQALAKALVLATSNGVRECEPDNKLRTPAIYDDPVGEMAETTQ
jgi:hypothetical protein